MVFVCFLGAWVQASCVMCGASVCESEKCGRGVFLRVRFLGCTSKLWGRAGA